MKCFDRDCDREGTIRDPETPAIFVNPENPEGPTVQPVHCREHHDAMMRRRDECERSFDRMIAGFGRRW